MAAETRAGTTYHLCLHVRGALNWPKRKLRGCFTHPDGRAMTPDEARTALMDELSRGHECIPVGDECDNFDCKSGCRGHRPAAQNPEVQDA